MNHLDGIVTALLQGEEDAHENSLHVGALRAAIAIAVLAQNYGGANGPFRQVVVEGNAGLVQKREQFVVMAPEPFDQAPGLRVLPGCGDHFLQTLCQTGPARGIGLGRKFYAPAPQANRIGDQTAQFLGERRPVRPRRLVTFHVFEVAQQMHQALLPQRALHGVVRAPEIAHQRAGKFLGEKLQQRWTAPRPVDHEPAQLVRGEAPQPVRFAIDAPAGFVGVEYGRIQRFLLDGLVPRIENLCQTAPHLQQSARRHLEGQMKVEHFDNLREGIAQGIVQPRAEDQHAIAQRRARQGRAHHGLDLLFAPGTPVAVDGMLGDYRLDVFGNVFGISGAGFLAEAQSPPTLRADLGPVFFATIDARRHLAAAAGMALLAPGLLLAARGCRRLLVGWLHARGRGRRLMRSGRRRCPLLFEHLGLCQQREHHGLFALRVDSASLRFGKGRSQRNIARRRCQCLHASYNILCSYHTQTLYMVASDG